MQYSGSSFGLLLLEDVQQQAFGGNDKMKIYRYEVLNMMGFRIEEDYYYEQTSAEQRFNEKIESWKNSKILCKKEDCNHQNKPIKFNKIDKQLDKNLIKEATIEYWYQTSYEYDEWDTSIQYIRILEIEVK